MKAVVCNAWGLPDPLVVEEHTDQIATINYGTHELRDAIKAATDGRGPDVIYDPVGGDYSEAAFRSIAWGGRWRYRCTPVRRRVRRRARMPRDPVEWISCAVLPQTNRTPPSSSGVLRMRFPVSANTAFASAGATGGVPTSPMPPGFPPDCSNSTCTFGTSDPRGNWKLWKLLCSTRPFLIVILARIA